MSFIVLNIQTSALWAETIYYELAALGFDAIMEDENGAWLTSVPEEQYDEQQTLTVLEQYKEQISYQVTKQEKQNWNKEWEDSFEPIRIDKKCIIRADFHPSEEGYKHELIITPQMSFGTGHHQTTRLMIKEQLKLDFENKSVLDAGTGTGVLGILAKKLGASKVAACDVEDWSVANALENAKRNDVELEALHGTVSLFEGRTFDVVLANINKNVLLSEMKSYSDLLASKGFLLLSGFHEKDIDDLASIAGQNHLKKISTSQEDDWCCIKLQKL